MRNKIILVIVLLLGLIWISCSHGMMLVGGKPPASSGDSCTSNLVFSWHCENEDVTLGTPAGCSAGDTTATAASSAAISGTQYHDGSNSCSFPTSADFYSFDPASILTTLNTGATMQAWVYVDTWADATARIVIFNNGSTTYWRTTAAGSANNDIEFSCSYDSGAATSVTVTTDGVNGVEDTWYKVICKARTDDTDPNLGIYVYDTSNSLLDSAESNTNLAAPDSAWNAFTVGNNNTSTSVTYDDEVKIWSSWQ